MRKNRGRRTSSADDVLTRKLNKALAILAWVTDFLKQVEARDKPLLPTGFAEIPDRRPLRAIQDFMREEIRKMSIRRYANRTLGSRKWWAGITGLVVVLFNAWVVRGGPLFWQEAVAVLAWAAAGAHTIGYLEAKLGKEDHLSE